MPTEPTTAAAIADMDRPAPCAEPEAQGRVPLGVAFFGHDSSESTIIKRVAGFAACGASVHGFMFRRLRDGNRRHAACETVPLGVTVDRNYLARIPKLVGALARLAARSKQLRLADVLYARNIDMLFLAVAARVIAGSRAAIVYEVLDVQRAFVGTSPINRLFRRAERALMGRCALLVVSSPDFVTRYFAPTQSYTGPVYLLANKIPREASVLASVAASTPPPPGPPWIIGWFGTLRCQRSLQVLSAIADALGRRVEIQIRGIPSAEDLTERQIRSACATRANMRYFGPYRSPQDLGAIYGGVHFVWSIDYLDTGGNSDWLLPNRVYEGGAFGAVSLARRNTATGRLVQRLAAGPTFVEPLEEHVIEFLLSLDAATWGSMHERVRAVPRSEFVDEDDTRTLVALMRQLARGRRP